MVCNRILAASIIILISFIEISLAIKVCPTEQDYDSLFPNPKCTDNPDAGATPKEIIDRWKTSTVTEHTLTTSDGYLFLVVEAVPNNEDTSASPVVLGHGIAMTCRGFLNLQNNTLAYNLLKVQRRRIYLIAFRGTIFSIGTTNGLTVNNETYWNYTYHQLGIEEVAKTIELAKRLTNNKVMYVGYSMGSTAGFVLCSKQPQFCTDNLVGIVALAPVAFLDISIPSILGKLSLIWPIIEPGATEIYKGRIMPRNEDQLMAYTFNSISMLSWYNQRAPLFGYNQDDIPWPFYPVCLINNPDAMCQKVVDHYSQNINSGKFREFDYGDKNIDVYGTSDPPDYPVEKIPVPVALFTGKNDALATESNALKLWNSLALKSRCYKISVNCSKFTHDNFVTSEHLYQLLTDPALTVISNMEQNVCNPLA